MFHAGRELGIALSSPWIPMSIQNRENVNKIYNNIIINECEERNKTYTNFVLIKINCNYFAIKIQYMGIYLPGVAW